LKCVEDEIVPRTPRHIGSPRAEHADDRRDHDTSPELPLGDDRRQGAGPRVGNQHEQGGRSKKEGIQGGEADQDSPGLVRLVQVEDGSSWRQLEMIA